MTTGTETDATYPRLLPIQRLGSIFLPEVTARRAAMFERKGRLVHYTTADNALAILRSKEVWLRNVRYMNDFSEVEHGIQMLVRFFRQANSEFPDVGHNELKQALERVRPGVLAKSISLFNTWIPSIEAKTFITCLSEHDDDEDEIGRLSMWRGYGRGANPVALVINPAPFALFGDALGAYSSPVLYRTQDQFFESMREIPKRIEAEHEFLQHTDEDILVQMIFQMLLASAISQKHRGFAEEREWRVLHVQGVHQPGKLTKATVSIGGAPQPVLKLPLQNIPEAGYFGIEIPELLNRIIIGPSSFPDAIWEGFVDVLREIGVEGAEQKVVVSDIPLRP